MKAESIRESIHYKKMNLKDVATAMNQSDQNFNNKLKRGGIGVSADKELENMAQVLGAKYYNYFQFPDGKRFGDYPTETEENKESNLESIEKEDLGYPLYRPKIIWVKASDLYRKTKVENTSLKDWIAFRLKWENENRKMIGNKPILEGIDYVQITDDWLLSLELASSIDHDLMQIKEK